MHYVLVFVMALMLAACNQPKDATVTPTVQQTGSIEGEYKYVKDLGSTTKGTNQFFLKANGDAEFHQYYSDGKLFGIQKAKYVIDNKVVKFVQTTKFPFDYLEINADGSLGRPKFGILMVKV